MPHTTSDDLRFRAKLLRIGCFATLAAFVVLLTLIVIVFPMVARTVGLTTPSADEAAVRTVLDAQVAAWNKGDLDGFMAGYWRDDNLMFTSGDKITKGWNATRDRYQTRYFTPLVRGRYFLKVGARTDTGRFTLTFRKLPDGWKITSDHTSVDCPPEKKDKPPGGG
jgi:beta-aspartyl-peptidase (threonine type)